MNIICKEGRLSSDLSDGKNQNSFVLKRKFLGWCHDKLTTQRSYTPLSTSSSVFHQKTKTRQKIQTFAFSLYIHPHSHSQQIISLSTSGKIEANTGKASLNFLSTNKKSHLHLPGTFPLASCHSRRLLPLLVHHPPSSLLDCPLVVGQETPVHRLYSRTICHANMAHSLS